MRSLTILGSSLLVATLAACAPPPAAVIPASPVAAPPPAKASIPQRYAASLPASPPSPERRAKARALLPKLDQLFAEDLAKQHYPGMGVGVVLDGELVYARGFGYRDVEAKAPFTEDTVFQIASVTKSFTAMAVLKLRDEGKLSLDAPAAQYYPPLARLAYPTKDSPLLTIRHLLSHGSGLPEDNTWLDPYLDMPESVLDGLLASGMSFSRAPDTHFEYSNLAFALLGKIIASVSGVPAREYIRREILGPLGMTASVFEADEAPRDRLARGYRVEDAKGSEKKAAPIPKDGLFDVTGGLLSSVRDMGRYLAYHLSAWPPGDAPEVGPVRRSTLREMHQGSRRGDFNEVLQALLLGAPFPTVWTRPDDRLGMHSFNYGSGLMTGITCADDHLVEHSGGLPGYTTLLTMLPEQGFGIVLFVNDEQVSSRPDLDTIALFREAGLLEERFAPPTPALAAAHDGVDALFQTWSVEPAKKLFEPTFFFYQSAERLGEQLAELRKKHGACTPRGPLHAPNRLRGSWELGCERGSITFAVSLTPRESPLVQGLLWESNLPPTPALAKAAAGIAGLVARWNEPAARALFAPAVDLAQAKKTLAHLGIDHGSCAVDKPIKGDGDKEGVFHLSCHDGSLDLSVTLDPATSRLTAWRAVPPRSAESRFCAR